MTTLRRLIHESVAAGTDRESSVESVSVVEDEGRAREIAGATKIWRDSRRQRGLALAAVSRRLKRGDTTALEDYPPPPVPDSDDPLIGEALPKYVGFVDAHPRTHNFRPREPRKELFHDSFRSMRLWEPRAAFRGGGVRDEERSRALAAAQAAIEPPLLPAVHEPTVHGRSAFIDRSKVVPRDRSRPDFRCVLTTQGQPSPRFVLGQSQHAPLRSPASHDFSAPHPFGPGARDTAWSCSRTHTSGATLSTRPLRAAIRSDCGRRARTGAPRMRTGTPSTRSPRPFAGSASSASQTRTPSRARRAPSRAGRTVRDPPLPLPRSTPLRAHGPRPPARSPRPSLTRRQRP